MSEYTLSILDPNTLLPHRAGIAGLALALSVMKQQDAPLTWKVTEEQVQLAWQGSDHQVVKWLLNETYQIRDGYLDAPALNLDDQGKYTFTTGILSTFLQHPRQHKRDSNEVDKAFTIEEGQPEILLKFKPLLSCYYTEDLKEPFNTKGAFREMIELKGQHLPGLVECFVNGPYQESPQNFIPLLFLPLACHYYELPGFRSIVLIPEVTNLIKWVRRRPEISGRTYRDYRSSSAGESALKFLFQENIADDAKLERVEYCEVYQLGKQTWDSNQRHLKQSVRRVELKEGVLRLYSQATQLFPSRVVQPKVDGQNKAGQPWLATSATLAWICDNLIAGKVWYAGFFEFRKHQEIYEREGLVKMAEELTEQERVLFNAVQGSFRVYLARQGEQASKQGREMDYGQVTDKVVYRMQRPSTQQEFATALVDFLSQFRGKASQGVGLDIYQWIHRQENWRTARDLTLLAIATYVGVEKETGRAESPKSPTEADQENPGMYEMQF